MKKIYFTLLAVLSLVFFSTGAIAQNQPLACQDDASAGLSWKNGQWVVTRFVAKKFILVKTKDGFTQQSLEKAIGLRSFKLQCRFDGKRSTCSDIFGLYLVFDSSTLKGGYSNLFGSTQAEDDATKDTPYLTAFSCTSF